MAVPPAPPASSGARHHVARECQGPASQCAHRPSPTPGHARLQAHGWLLISFRAKYNPQDKAPDGVLCLGGRGGWQWGTAGREGKVNIPLGQASGLFTKPPALTVILASKTAV
jgi:hypothetical protein